LRLRQGIFYIVFDIGYLVDVIVGVDIASALLMFSFNIFAVADLVIVIGKSGDKLGSGVGVRNIG